MCKQKTTAFSHCRWISRVCLIGWSVATGAFAQTIDASPENLASLRQEARAYEHGEGVPRDIDKATKLYCDAARLGDADAQFSLGWIYANGRGVDRNDSLAAYFFSLAAQQGYHQAERMLRQTGEPVASPPECMQPEAEVQAEPDQPTDPPQSLIGAPQRIVDLVSKIAPNYGVSPRFALAIIRAESNFNAAALSPKNAQGLMQLIPDTAARFNVSKPFDPEQNIRGGLSYLRWLLAYFQGNVELVAAAYNSGEKTVDRYLGVPPYQETQVYVRKIRSMFGKDEHPFDPKITRPSPEISRLLKRRMM
ncbi:MAG: Lytic transglycosylase, catalytic [Proteobacteria bacterium]|nr:Lytic transglycosylase, catalytic [Pseudomonadota bacterium]